MLLQQSTYTGHGRKLWDVPRLPAWLGRLNDDAKAGTLLRHCNVRHSRSGCDKHWCHNSSWYLEILSFPTNRKPPKNCKYRVDRVTSSMVWRVAWFISKINRPTCLTTNSFWTCWVWIAPVSHFFIRTFIVVQVFCLSVEDKRLTYYSKGRKRSSEDSSLSSVKAEDKEG